MRGKHAPKSKQAAKRSRRKPIVGAGFQAVHPGAEITPEARELALAIEAHRQRTGQRFPSWSDVLQVVLSLGYRKVSDERCPQESARGPEGGPEGAGHQEEEGAATGGAGQPLLPGRRRPQGRGADALPGAASCAAGLAHPAKNFGHGAQDHQVRQ